VNAAKLETVSLPGRETNTVSYGMGNKKGEEKNPVNEKSERCHYLNIASPSQLCCIVGWTLKGGKRAKKKEG